MRHVAAAILCLLAAACGSDHGAVVETGANVVGVRVHSFRPAGSYYVGKVYVEEDAQVVIVRRGGFLYAVDLPDRCPTGSIRQRVGRDISMRETFVRYADGAVERTISDADAIEAICRGIDTRT